MILGLLLLAVFSMSLLLTLLLRRYALNNSLIDVPNARSSHSLPTPRGGGISIVLSFLGALLIAALVGAISWAVFLGLFGAGLTVAVIGFADDHGHVAARWRLLGHFASAAWLLFWLGGLAPVSLFGVSVDLGWCGSLLGVVYLVWMLNLYNFMDGIDGIASVEAVCATVGMAIIYWLGGFSAHVWTCLLLAAAVSGFLYWNFPPAKIFMGDAGSGFLGLMLGGLCLQSGWVVPELFWSWLIMLGVFIVDATSTLLRRLIRGEKVYEAHRSHGYQHASRKYASHKKVTLTVVAVNIAWLLPLAIWVGVGGLDGLTGLLLAYAPLCWLAWIFDAGASEVPRSTSP